MPIELDLNDTGFQHQMVRLEKNESLAFFKTLRKLLQLEGETVYRDRGLNWEAIQSKTDDDGERLYSLRVTEKCRAVVQRRGNRMVFQGLYPDHDSAY